eukprot:5196079-Amphidinium_carterae.1
MRSSCEAYATLPHMGTCGFCCMSAPSSSTQPMRSGSSLCAKSSFANRSWAHALQEQEASLHLV